MSWSKQLASAIRDSETLRSYLDIEMHGIGANSLAEFPLLIPLSYAERLRGAGPDNPLLKQVLPSPAEDQLTEGYDDDPLGEQRFLVAPGTIHKYIERVLLLLTKACPIHCRYCFRRQLWKRAESRFSVELALGYIASHSELREVIWSGGDPLMLPDRQLARLASRLEELSHLQRLRLHTRMPTLIPERITPELLAWLGAGRLAKIIVLHVNHAQELNSEVGRACAALREAGVLLLNQSVLLRDINDNLESLINLSETLSSFGILPYYLHMLDQVRGAAHFAVPLAYALQLEEQLRARLPGYLVPRLVRDLPGSPAKLPARNFL